MKFTPTVIQAILDGTLDAELGLSEADIRAVREDLDAGVRHIGLHDGMLLREEGKAKPKVNRYLMSTETPLGMFKDSIKVSGWDLGDFKKRGQPFLFNHNTVEAHSKLPLGNMDKVTKGTARDMKALSGDAHFTPEGMSPFNDLVRQMVDEDLMRGGSVGFVPSESREPSKKERAEREGFGPMSMVFTKTGLIEFSATPVGMDPDATTIRTAANTALEARLAALIEAGEYDAEVGQEFRRQMFGLTPKPATTSTFDFGGVHEGTTAEPAPVQRTIVTSSSDEGLVQTITTGGGSHLRYGDVTNDLTTASTTGNIGTFWPAVGPTKEEVESLRTNLQDAFEDTQEAHQRVTELEEQVADLRQALATIHEVLGIDVGLRTADEEEPETGDVTVNVYDALFPELAGK
jgi:hypothetical protein